MRIRVNKKSGFASADKLLKVYHRGKPFYIKYNKSKGGVIHFNLPPGVYTTSNNVTRLPKPVEYTLPKLPPPEERTTIPRNFRIIYKTNKNKCSIYLNRGVIVCDPSIKEKPKSFRAYVFYHEIGHYFYKGNGQKSEENCDRFAQRQMLKRGYNPSQTDYASEFTLGKSKLSRKRKHLTKIRAKKTEKMNYR